METQSQQEVAVGRQEMASYSSTKHVNFRLDTDITVCIYMTTQAGFWSVAALLTVSIPSRVETENIRVALAGTLS